MNEILTAYLYCFYAARRGAVSSADSMSHILDMMAMARGAKQSAMGAVALGTRALGLGKPDRRHPDA